ncbi:MAG: error-prone DNA polymerase [Alphaproteobacteria bacterium]
MLDPTAYAELQVTSNFSFLRGASHPEELTATAAALGLAAVALTDRNSLAGIVRAHGGAKEAGIRFVVGCRLDLTGGPSLLCYPTDRAAYGRLCRLLTRGKRRASKSACRIEKADVAEFGQGQIVIALPPEGPDDGFADELDWLRENFAGRCYLAVHRLYRGDDAGRCAWLAALAARRDIPLVATNDVHAHEPRRRPLQDVLTCIREKCTIHEAGRRLAANAERHLKPPGEMARLFRDTPEAVARTVEIAGRCRFSLDELRYEYPVDPVPGGRTPQEELARLAHSGAGERYPSGVPDKVLAAIGHELRVIGTLGYAPYFLTVHDIVRFARSRGILCQGRGSAANSAVCYCLGITAVDPARIDLLFERFVSSARNEPPDIDVDFEHERREEVIQYIYRKYGRERAALTATVIRYRARSAVRDVGKALGLSLDATGALAGTIWGWSREGLDAARVREAGLDPEDVTVAQTMCLGRELIGFPRHLSQHVGGFVITRDLLSELVPIENAAMPERTVIEWDKDDLDALGILKIDVLGLGMLTCIRRAFDLLARHHGRDLDLATVPGEDAAVYDMLCRADSIGVFQVESRAQMTMLPRLRPRCFYDLVIEVAIVRPGPIQGDMVHPYLRRRGGKEEVSFPSPELREVLGKTLGVPLFQEQAMKIAIVAAGFTAAEADGLRRAMAAFRRPGTIQTFRDKLIDGMVKRGYDEDFAQRCYKQIEGFGTYGFPESHAASFALLVYVSAWFKCHYPDVFACALLNSQPMGFYAPAQIVRDAREHGAEVRPVDVNHSAWDCTLEPPGDGPPRALRLGFRQIKGFARADAERLAQARPSGGYGVMDELRRHAAVERAALETLARADAFRSLGLDRRQALWAIRGLDPAPLPLFAAAETAARMETPASTAKENPAPDAKEDQDRTPTAPLPAMSLGEHVIEDYRSLRLSLKEHPAALLRKELARRGYRPCAVLGNRPAGTRVSVAGLVLVRQRPGSASGVIFVTLEDEGGIANLVVWPGVFEAFRPVVLKSRLMGVTGKVQREGEVIHVVAERLVDLSPLLPTLAEMAEDAAATGSTAGPTRSSKALDGEGARTHGLPATHRRKSDLGVRSRDFH